MLVAAAVVVLAVVCIAAGVGPALVAVAAGLIGTAGVVAPVVIVGAAVVIDGEGGVGVVAAAVTAVVTDACTVIGADTGGDAEAESKGEDEEECCVFHEIVDWIVAFILWYSVVVR